MAHSLLEDGTWQAQPCGSLCTANPLKPVDAQMRLKWRKAASYTTTIHKETLRWHYQSSISTMWTEWHILILSIMMESVELHRQSQGQSLSIVRQKKLQYKIQRKSRWSKEYCNMDHSKGNRGNLNPNTHIFLSCNETKTKSLGVWFLADFTTHTSF